VDAIVVGSGTVAIDNPSLTARHTDGTLMAHQPLRVIVGMSDLPAGATLSTAQPGESEILHLRTHDVNNVLAALGERSVRHVLVEGGPTLAAAFVRAQAVDRIEWYTAPVLFGSGIHAMGDLGITNIAQVQRWRMVSVAAMGEDAKIIAVADRSSTNASPRQEE
jgi:diaminohydroxyphosphoribosylaminopyrimidine deaminase/5-amino-6-(5-phosphoribosylamino)uracil reductase